MQQQGLLAGGKNVALTGRVYVLADASNRTDQAGRLIDDFQRARPCHEGH